jgi:hypothetical protein
MSAVVKFPRRERVLEKKGLNFADLQAYLDGEIRAVDNAMAALQRRRKHLLAEYREELARKVGQA